MRNLLYSGNMGMIPEVLAHGAEEVVGQAGSVLDQVIRSNSIKFTVISLIIFFVLTTISLLIRNKVEWLKYLLFSGFVIVTLSNTIYLAGSTIYLNHQSTTGGPVHWHADFEIWNCGDKVDLVNPKGLSNKVGTEAVHEHNDNRIHIEGIILEANDASISHFLKAVGGELHSDHLSIPTEDGVIILENGQSCLDGQASELQVFVYRTAKGFFSQTKLTNPESYVISPESQVPPGDCIIIEFGEPKEKTDKLCNFYTIELQKGKIHER